MCSSCCSWGIRGGGNLERVGTIAPELAGSAVGPLLEETQPEEHDCDKAGGCPCMDTLLKGAGVQWCALRID